PVMELHSLLRRQLKRLGVDAAGLAAAAEPWPALCHRVSRAYEEHDQERDLLERSQDLASQEMSVLYAAARADRDQLENRVQERTAALRVSEARLSSLLALSADWIWEQDEELRFTYISPGIEVAAGIKVADLLDRRRFYDENFDGPAEALAGHRADLDARRPFRDFTYRMKRANGEHRYVRISGEPVLDEDGGFRGYRGVGRDVTEIVLAEQKVQELASYDSLTGLPNRNMFLTELDRALGRARRQQQSCAVCFIDLDRFKTINDRLGHSAGDLLLKMMGGRLREALRDCDLVARLGGDEFVVLIEGSSDVADLTSVAQKMLAALGEPFTLRGSSFTITGSIGIGLFPDDGADAASLLGHADAAMYLAKARGKNNVQFYSAELAAEAERQFSLESQLRLALARNELFLHYQPRVEIASGRMRSAEALLRWAHPERGLVPPDEFIALAEERGLIIPIGRWVFHAACRQLRDWRAAGLEPPPIAVNLSAKQFACDSLVDDLVDAMAQNGVAPADLEVELTESALMAEPERANEVLQRLHRMGVRIAIDDFGTGYSSLSYLKRFPAQTVKIDRSFIRGLPHDHNDKAITQAVIAMAHSLGLGVVAEGVESEDQLALLRELGCDEAQGYLLGRPMSAEALARRIAAATLAMTVAA
ncbi:MAG: EAL domain-containing protein, partial [Pseudomonadota bacterium]|nr:EAL domain-containing protein [Pseudomonadota bacterium]